MVKKCYQLPRHDFEELLKKGKINKQTIVFNNLVQNLKRTGNQMGSAI